MKPIAEKDYLAAMKADMIPEGWSGLWYVSRFYVTKNTPTIRDKKAVIVPPGQYTFLRRLTDDTIYQEIPGEVVMEDSEEELRTHLDFVMNVSGRVLVTGLGLGCVIRGLLANPLVKHITVIEKSTDVLKLVAPSFMALNDDRLEIVEADALQWTVKNTDHFDYGWHDLWTDRAAGEPHLDDWHTKLLMNCRATVKNQGAWAFDERLKTILVKSGFSWIG